MEYLCKTENVCVCRYVGEGTGFQVVFSFPKENLHVQQLSGRTRVQTTQRLLSLKFRLLDSTSSGICAYRYGTLSQVTADMQET